MVKREVWGTRVGFLMAAMGSAIGLGNIWRFPFICYQNGGGAFLIPFFVALITCGVPLMILEFGIGHWSRSGAPSTFAKINKKCEWLGWWAIFVAFIMVTYYCVIMAWCLCYMVHSCTLAWVPDAGAFFTEFLGATQGPGVLGQISLPILGALGVVWAIIFLILHKGVKRIGKVVIYTVMIPWLLLIILAIRGLTLPGAIEGINYYLTPDFKVLASPKVWLAAYAQIFFSLSLAAGVMIAYASYLPKKSEITNNTFIISFADAGTAFFASFAVFSTLGYLAQTTGVGIGEVAVSGPGLTFVTYPTAISMFPVGASLFGVAFFTCLFFLGVDSAFSLVEGISTGLVGKWNISKKKATAIVCLLGCSIGVVYTTGAGSHWLDISRPLHS
jgi:NSS family neurotransmitter:Na+ symporter